MRGGPNRGPLTNPTNLARATNFRRTAVVHLRRARCPPHPPIPARPHPQARLQLSTPRLETDKTNLRTKNPRDQEGGERSGELP